MSLFLEGEHRQPVNCHFRSNCLKKRDTLHRGWTPSTPDTLQHSLYYDCRVDISVCAFLLIKCHFEPVWPVRNGLTQRILFLSYPLSFSLPPNALLRFRGSIPLSDVFLYGQFSVRCLSLQSRALLCPEASLLGFIWTDPGSRMPFKAFWCVPAL